MAGAIFGSWRVTLAALRIVNDVSYLMRIYPEIHFAWQAQYLVTLECHFSWQAQHFVKFWKIAGARNVVFSHTKCVSKMGIRSPKRRVRDDHFIFGYVRICSEHGRIVLILAEAIQGFSADILKSEFRGRRRIWCSWTVTSVAPHNVNDVSYLMRINPEIDFAWQAQYLVKMEDDSCFSAHCK